MLCPWRLMGMSCFSWLGHSSIPYRDGDVGDPSMQPGGSAALPRESKEFHTGLRSLHKLCFQASPNYSQSPFHAPWPLNGVDV